METIPQDLDYNAQNLHRWAICCGELADMVPAGTRIAAKNCMLRGGIAKSRLCAEQFDSTVAGTSSLIRQQWHKQSALGGLPLIGCAGALATLKSLLDYNV